MGGTFLDWEQPIVPSLSQIFFPIFFSIRILSVLAMESEDRVKHFASYVTNQLVNNEASQQVNSLHNMMIVFHL